jgi:uncharacterized protein YciW
MKLILDSAALERLLGGDSDLEVKLRVDVANQFADKFLKSLVNSQLTSTTGKQIENLIRKEIVTGSAWVKTLTPKYQQMISEAVVESLGILIKEEVKAVLDSKHYSKLLADFVEQEANRIATEWTAGNIEQRIQQAADKKIKERLNLS